MWQLLVLIILAGTCTSCCAFSRGAPAGTCISLTPKHNTSETASLAELFAITTSTNQYSPGENVTVTIRGVDGTKFRGFLVQFRKTSDNITAVGTAASTQGKPICNETSITHTDADEKASVSVEWSAPSSSMGDVRVWASIVQTRPVWTIIKGPIINAQSAPSGSVLPPISSPQPIQSSACGSTKSCFQNSVACSTDCDYIVSWETEGDEIKFELSGITSGYVAIGFSKDALMGDDNVVMCTVRGAIIHQYQAGKHRPTPIDAADPHFGLTSVSIGSDGQGRVSCTFSRKKTFVGTGNASQVFDLANSYYLLYAYGDIDSDGYSRKHADMPAMSGEKIDFSSNPQLLAEKTDHPLAKAHACLMLIAWVGLASVGIIIARYYKQQCGDSTLCGQKVWFAMHRGCMLSVVVLNILAFVLILAELNWTWSSQVAHSVIGIVVICLTVVQPIMALFRPHPDGPNRRIFNWAHWFVGVSTHFLSAVAIFLGMRTPRLHLPDYVVHIMIIFVVCHVMVSVMLEFHQRSLNKAKESSLEEYPMMQKDDTPLPTATNRGQSVRNTIILLYAFATVVLIAAVLVAVAK